jgi:hypothetical protein
MRPSELDIRELLSGEASLSLTEGTDLFSYKLPLEPQNCTVVMGNPGRAALVALNKTTSDLYYPSITIWVRNKSYAAGWQISFDVMEFLHGSSLVVVDTTKYLAIVATADPQLLHWDENDRAVFITNYDIIRRDN